MNLKRALVILLFIQLISFAGWAQKNLSVTQRKSVTFDLSALIASGTNNEMVTDNSQWINYTMQVHHGDPLSSISVGIASGTIPSGIELYMQADYDNGSGWGRVGTPAGKVKVDYAPKVLINGIGNSSTGNGKHKGHKLIFSLVITDFALLQSGDYTLYIQYTLN